MARTIPHDNMGKIQSAHSANGFAPAGQIASHRKPMPAKANRTSVTGGTSQCDERNFQTHHFAQAMGWRHPVMGRLITSLTTHSVEPSGRMKYVRPASFTATPSGWYVIVVAGRPGARRSRYARLARRFRSK
ncbi:MAG: hypothetical protein BWY09_03227 [Candidatus Hydrogenedentes bacterium ADurb.Bin179]|nr:MAG: hypothetical protein BWY09_03227 [Candidatus Hydrogenedentes bacterium ADurb.Bin179]